MGGREKEPASLWPAFKCHRGTGHDRNASYGGTGGPECGDGGGRGSAWGQGRPGCRGLGPFDCVQMVT